MLNPSGKTEVGELHENLVTFSDLAVIKEKAFFAYRQGEMVAAGKDWLEAAQTFLCRSLQGRVLGWVVPDGLNLLDHSGESGSNQVMKFAGILHILSSDPRPFLLHQCLSYQFDARYKTSQHSK